MNTVVRSVEAAKPDIARSEVRDGMRIDWDLPIVMDDGLVLRADVFRPIAETRYPVILSYGPYGKGLAFQDGYSTCWEKMVTQHPDVASGSSSKYQNWEVVDPEKWVPHGYACVRVNSRGAGRSPGYLEPFGMRETQDIYHCIEWAAAQRWSTGKVGMNGISYYAVNQWLVAALEPPHLAAMCIWEGLSDNYRDANYHGGIMQTMPRNWWDMQIMHVQHGYGTRGFRSRVTGELVAGPETLSDEELVRQSRALRRRLGRASVRRRLPSRTHGAIRQDQGAVPLRRQLGRAGPAHPRQCGGLRALRLQAEMAGDARARTLDRVLHRLRR